MLKKRAIQLLLIFTSLAIIAFLGLSSLGTFRDQLLSTLNRKQDSFASSPTDTSHTLGVLVIKYFPLTINGQNIDIAVTGDVGDPTALVKQRVNSTTQNLLVAITKSTTYLGYQDNNAEPAIKLSLVDTKQYDQAVPLAPDGTRRPNYSKIMSDHNICNYVDNQNVREVFLWAYQGPAYPGTTVPYLNISESKMSGPFGDISNSYRLGDMPVCNNTYRVYTLNYGRGTAEALHSWGHQIEAEIDAVDQQVFRNLFQGVNYPQTLGVNGRCGSVHNPPNARSEYDYANPTSQDSDCLNWKPDGIGTVSPISCSTWKGCLENGDNDNPQLNYQVWMWQNLPGRYNPKWYQGKKIRNIWDIHGNFDRVMREDKTIFLSVAPSPPGSFNFNNAPVPFCHAPNDSRITIRWWPSEGATSYTITPQTSNKAKGNNGWFPVINVDNPPLQPGGYKEHTYQIPGTISPGESWEFSLAASNEVGTTKVVGGSSYYVTGWTNVLQCSNPGSFDFNGAPSSFCQGPNDSRITIRWWPSEGATSYTLTPQTTNATKGANGWLPAINVGNPPLQPGGYKEYTYQTPGTVAAGESWEFTLVASNEVGTSKVVGQSSYYVVGWTPALECLNPSPSPSPTIKPSSTPKPGDTDGNGTVDIFDYNRIVTHFGSTDMNNHEIKKADLNKNNLIDIYDYNQVISNFGL